MKRISCLILCAALSLSLALPASAAKVGSVVNHALYTDIVAQIDGHPLRSYNVDGRTAVVAEDLRGYGFYALWDPVDRTLKVERATDASGQPETPEVWPEYTPESLKHPIGSRAQDILSTDIQVYVAGEYVQSFNINGETLIWFSDLDAYGPVTFDEENRTANLTLGDPMQIQLDQLVHDIENWEKIVGVPSYSYELYPGQIGTLFVGYRDGTMHGQRCDLVFVEKNGTKLYLNDLFPHYPWGAEFYLQPREFQFSDSGEELSFITPVKEILDWEAGTSRDWGDTLCKVNLVTGTMESMQPLSQPAAQ